MLVPLQANTPTAIDQAFVRMYNFDFAGARLLLDDHISRDPQDAFAYAARASGILFEELDRLGILESEFFRDDDRIAAKSGLRPDPARRARFFADLAAAEQHANVRLGSAPSDTSALFTKALGLGLKTDYVALIEKRQLRSLTWAKQSQALAVQVLKIDPNFTDAYLTTGITEYLLGSLPFFVKWIVRFDAVEGDKQKAVRNLQRVAAGGRYLGPFARILLAVISLRERKPENAILQLETLVRDFPQNPLFRKELRKLTDRRIGSGRAVSAN